MKQSYSEKELQTIIENIQPRSGWDFSSIKTVSTPPWDYISVVKGYIKPSDKVLDIGTGGGEQFLRLARNFSSGIGIDRDPEMVKVAVSNGKNIDNTSFLTNDGNLDGLDNDFDIILNRHAPFNLQAVNGHLVGDGLFITQQVGESNMRNIKEALGQPILNPPIDTIMISSNGLKTIVFKEYDIKYIVKDIESLVFWLNALDKLHADIESSGVLKSVDILNKILKAM